MEFRILGPVEVHAAGQRVDAGHARQRSVLAVLILDLCRVVSAEALIDRVWGEAPPNSVRNVLHGYVAKLRARIAEAADPRVVLARHQGGYLLQAEPEQVDVYRFRRMLAETAAVGQDDQSAAALLEDALTLWHGPALAGLDSPWLDRMRDRLEIERVGAVLDLNDIRLRQGRHGALSGELAEQAASAPADERLIGQLMLALYRSGRQAEALRWFERTRAHLADELGADPGPELRGLHQRILTADPALELKHSLRLTTGPAVQAAPRQLPAAVSHFVGRTHELAVLTELLDRSERQASRAVVVSAIGGTAGVGKTALAVHWAHRVAKRFPDGQLYANLRGWDPSGTPATSAEIARRFLNALGVPDSRIPSDPESLESLYRSTLADQRVLIVLDNARNAAQVRPLLPGGPGCFVLVTSRNQLASLAAAEGAHMLTVDLFSQHDAYELVARRLDHGRVQDEPAAVSELIELCARLPIAVGIAVARAAAQPAVPIAGLVAELRDTSSRLDVLDAGDPGSSVRAVFSWSYQNLSGVAARMFRLLSVHAGPDISIPAAASLACLPLDQARRAVGELTGSHLLTEHAHGRFTCHDLLRAYSADQARTEDHKAERDAAMLRLLDHYLHSSYATSRLLDPTLTTTSLGPPQPGTLPEAPGGYEQAWTWAETEHQVLLAVARQATATGFEMYAWQILHALEPFFYRLGLWHEFAAAEHIALEAALRTGDVAGQASAHRGIGHVYAFIGSLEEAYAHLSQAVAGFRKLGNRADEARAHVNLGRVCRLQGRYGEALSEARKALRLYRAAGHPGGQAGALNNVGLYHVYLGNYQEALACCQKALTGFRELGNRHGMAHALDSVGYAYHFLGESDEAIAYYQQSLEAFRECGDRYSEADTLIHLGETHHVLGDQPATRRAWQSALSILIELHHPDASQVQAKLAKLGDLELSATKASTLK